MRRVRFEPLGRHGKNLPFAVDLAPTGATDLILACAREQQWPEQRIEWVSNTPGGCPKHPYLGVVKNALPVFPLADQDLGSKAIAGRML
jgi:hypothetical protein